MLLQCRFPQAIEVFEMRFEGRDYYLIEKENLASLFGAPEPPEPIAAVDPEPPPAKAKRVGGAKAKAQRKAKAPRAKQAAEPTDENAPSATNAVRAQLAKRPRTSGELVEALGPGIAAQAVYFALSMMRKAGEVETRPDENGTRRNYLNGGAA